MTERIFTRRWAPNSAAPTRPCGVYLLHGTGEHSGRYEELAVSLSAAGWAVGAHDHPGHGQSGGERGSVQPLGVLAVQGALQIQRFANETGVAPIVFGHSLGGVLAAELLLTHHIEATGLILSAPAFRVWMSLKNRLRLALMYALVPDKVVELTYRPELLTQDSEKIVASQNDELIHGFRSARLIHWLGDSGASSIALAPKLAVDALVLVAGEDPVAEPKAAREWAARVPAEFVTVHEYPESYHEILNERKVIRNQAISDILAWLELRAGRA